MGIIIITEYGVVCAIDFIKCCVLCAGGSDAQPSRVPAVRQRRAVLPHPAGRRPAGAQGDGRAGNQAEDASADRRAQLGEAEL